MKSLLFIVLIFLTTLTITSCTRVYICQCVVKYTGNPPGLPDTAVHEFNIRDTKKGAKSACEANSTTVTQDNITMTEKCQLY